MPNTTEALTTALRTWTNDHDPHVRAAVELLIWRGWLNRPDFVRTCVHSDPDGRAAWVGWPRAREFHDKVAGGSTSEMAILDLAIELGRDRFRLYIMGDAHSKAVAAAVAMAVGEEYNPRWLSREGTQ